MKKLILISILVLSLFSCKKEIPIQKEKPVFTENLTIVPALEERGRAIKPKPAIILLDFDGHSFYVGVNATTFEKELVRTLLQQMFSLWEITTTLSETEYNNFVGLKQRVVLTDASIGVTGAAILFSMINGEGDIHPALINWVATRNITCCYTNEPNTYAAWVAAHEVGHTIGLHHQVRTCAEEYANVLNGYAPLMGNVLNAVNTGWVNNNPTFFIKYPECPTVQNDITLISKYIKKRR
jgi:hypothetical protein